MEENQSKRRKRQESSEKLPEKNKKVSSKKHNFWQYAFLTLVGIILAFVIIIGVRVTGTREVEFKKAQEQLVLPDDPSFQVSTNKAQLNKVISFYLNDFLKDSGVQYTFYLENQALLNGTFKVLGYPMEFFLYFEPYVMQDGNIQLKAKNVSIGSLGLPVSQVMNQVAGFDMPKWVEIDPKKEQIILHLDQLVIGNNIHLRADRINLVDDDIRMSVYLDLETENSNKKEE
ncbi:YpmS family protein [Vagococcus elongatus]|nr:YpmS family protein [Vagococcus elongatus]